MAHPPQVYCVVVTAAGGEPEGNPSPAVRDGLPAELSLNNGAVARILKYPIERTCSYRVMRETNQEIWSHDVSLYRDGDGVHDIHAAEELRPYIDLVLQIGKCTRKQPGYWVESKARRDVYKHVDDEGQAFPNGQLGPGGLWEGLPAELRPCFDVDRVVEKIAREHPGVQSGRSDDAGASFCELELYSSLAVCLCRRERLRAAFLHIPSGQLPEDIQTHIAVTETVIKALVEQLGEMDGRS